MDRPPVVEDISGFFKFHGVSDFTFESGLLVGNLSFYLTFCLMLFCGILVLVFTFVFSPDVAVGVEVPS